mmetsp:Transcript_28507/g.82546  ORF Transcript_28507/g.82546 Transcript_28507/m.82546 type:complete len:91 (-) Transcript_28507:401-673(-)
MHEGSGSSGSWLQGQIRKPCEPGLARHVELRGRRARKQTRLLSLKKGAEREELLCKARVLQSPPVAIFIARCMLLLSVMPRKASSAQSVP